MKMKEIELLGKLLPGHPDIFPIIQNIREKYQIPPVEPEDDITEILLTRDDIDWDAVKRDIDTQVRDIPFFDEKQEAFLQGIRKLRDTPFDFPEQAPVSAETREGQYMAASNACSGQWGVCAIYRPFSGFEFFLLPGRVPACPSAIHPLSGSNVYRWAAIIRVYNS